MVGIDVKIVACGDENKNSSLWAEVFVVPRLGIEPRFTASKAAVLPLDDLGGKGGERIADKRIKIKY
jgi:hypothetical protein